MNYILDGQDETERLQRQNSQTQYSITHELEALKLDLKGKKVLDAGCGIGSLSRLLALNSEADISACDASEIRIEAARKNSKNNINFFVAEITSLPCPDECYDVIFVRFVLEHTLNPKAILKDLYRVLKPQGQIIIIDLDGLIFNLHHQDDELGYFLGKLKKDLPIDLYIGRKLPRMMADLGFEVIDCIVHPMVFLKEDLESEVDNMVMRFYQSQVPIKEALGENNFERFINLYVSEMRKSHALVCNKFIVTSIKP